MARRRSLPPLKQRFWCLLVGKKRSEEQLNIPKSYLKLSTVNNSQRSIVMRFWNNLTDIQKATAIQDAKAAQLLNQQLSSSSRTQQTHSDEMCRLILKLFPEAQLYLTNSRQPMSRWVLDATHLGNWFHCMAHHPRSSILLVYVGDAPASRTRLLIGCREFVK